MGWLLILILSLIFANFNFVSSCAINSPPRKTSCPSTQTLYGYTPVNSTTTNAIFSCTGDQQIIALTIFNGSSPQTSKFSIEYAVVGIQFHCFDNTSSPVFGKTGSATVLTGPQIPTGIRSIIVSQSSSVGILALSYNSWTTEIAPGALISTNFTVDSIIARRDASSSCGLAGAVMLIDNFDHSLIGLRLIFGCPTSCPAGSTPKNYPGFHERTDQYCENCAQGYFKLDSGNHECQTCYDFSQCNTTTSFCLPGYYYFQGTCSRCTKNSYKPDVGNQGCTPCPLNAECFGSNYSCNAGYFHDKKNSMCVSCAVGQYKPLPGNNETCFECPNNATCVGTDWWCNSPDFTQSGTNCTKCDKPEGCFDRCPVGTFCHRTASFCLPGYEPRQGQCTPCANGLFKLDTDNSTCHSCPPNALNCSSASVTCPSGTGLLANNMTFCGKCGKTTLQSAIYCIPCPDNYICSDDGLSKECAPGFTLLLSPNRTESCVPCANGTEYKTEKGNHLCTQCPLNATCDSTSQLFKCNPGYTVSTNQRRCDACGRNTYKTSVGNFPCLSCPSNALSCTMDTVICPQNMKLDLTINTCVFSKCKDDCTVADQGRGGQELLIAVGSTVGIAFILVVGGFAVYRRYRSYWIGKTLKKRQERRKAYDIDDGGFGSFDVLVNGPVNMDDSSGNDLNKEKENVEKKSSDAGKSTSQNNPQISKSVEMEPILTSPKLTEAQTKSEFLSGKKVKNTKDADEMREDKKASLDRKQNQSQKEATLSPKEPKNAKEKSSNSPQMSGKKEKKRPKIPTSQKEIISPKTSASQREPTSSKPPSYELKETDARKSPTPLNQKHDSFKRSSEALLEKESRKAAVPVLREMLTSIIPQPKIATSPSNKSYQENEIPQLKISPKTFKSEEKSSITSTDNITRESISEGPPVPTKIITYQPVKQDSPMARKAPEPAKTDEKITLSREVLNKPLPIKSAMKSEGSPPKPKLAVSWGVLPCTGPDVPDKGTVRILRSQPDLFVTPPPPERSASLNDVERGDGEAPPSPSRLSLAKVDLMIIRKTREVSNDGESERIMSPSVPQKISSRGPTAQEEPTGPAISPEKPFSLRDLLKDEAENSPPVPTKGSIRTQNNQKDSPMVTISPKTSNASSSENRNIESPPVPSKGSVRPPMIQQNIIASPKAPSKPISMNDTPENEVSSSPPVPPKVPIKLPTGQSDTAASPKPQKLSNSSDNPSFPPVPPKSPPERLLTTQQDSLSAPKSQEKAMQPKDPLKSEVENSPPIPAKGSIQIHNYQKDIAVVAKSPKLSNSSNGSRSTDSPPVPSKGSIRAPMIQQNTIVSPRSPAKLSSLNDLSESNSPPVPPKGRLPSSQPNLSPSSSRPDSPASISVEQKQQQPPPLPPSPLKSPPKKKESDSDDRTNAQNSIHGLSQSLTSAPPSFLKPEPLLPIYSSADSIHNTVTMNKSRHGVNEHAGEYRRDSKSQKEVGEKKLPSAPVDGRNKIDGREKK